MRFSFGIFSIGFILTINLFAQDQIIYLNGDKDYVDKVEGIDNDSLTYTFLRKLG